MQLTNEWISGFVDGEGCFKVVKINRKKNKEEKIKYTKTNSPKELLIKENIGETPLVVDDTVLRHLFIVSINKKSTDVLYGLKRQFKCGTVHKGEGNIVSFQVSKTVHLNNIIVPFFQKYKLLTKKSDSFSSFVKSLENYNEKEGTHQIIEKKKEKQKEALSMTLPVGKPFLPTGRIRDKGDKKTVEQPFFYNFSDDWFRGFIDAQGCFTVLLQKDLSLPQLSIRLESKEKQMLVELGQFLKCGALIKRKDNLFILQISTLKDCERYIFPKLQTKGSAVLLRTIKRISYQKFRKIARLICEKKHQTVEGLEKIKKLITALNKENDYLSITKAEKELSIKK